MEQVKGLMTITGIILMICVIVTAAYTPKSAAMPSEQPPEVRELSVAESTLQEEMYKLSVYEEKVAAFEKGKDYPLYISDVYVSTLPKADRELLEKGIAASDRKTLNRLIEDYCS